MVTSPRGVDVGSAGALAVPPTGISGIGAGALVRPKSAVNCGALLRAANTPTPTTRRRATATNEKGTRLMSESLRRRDGRGRAGRQVGADGAFEISDRLAEIAQSAEVIQLRAEQHPL